MPTVYLTPEHEPPLPPAIATMIEERVCASCRHLLCDAKGFYAGCWLPNPPESSDPKGGDIGERPRCSIGVTCAHCDTDDFVSLDLSLDQALDLMRHLYCRHARVYSPRRRRSFRGEEA